VILQVGLFLDLFYSLKQVISYNIPASTTDTKGTDVEATPRKYDYLEQQNHREIAGPQRSTLQIKEEMKKGSLPRLPTVRDLFVLMESVQTGTPLPILNLLYQTRAFRSTQPCDRVFALVGLSCDIDPKFIDYSKSTGDIEVDAARIEVDVARISMRLGRSWGPYVLSFVDGQDLVGSSSVPTWVPRWVDTVPFHVPLASNLYDNDLLLAYPVGTPTWDIDLNKVSASSLRRGKSGRVVVQLGIEPCSSAA